MQKKIKKLLTFLVIISLVRNGPGRFLLNLFFFFNFVFKEKCMSSKIFFFKELSTVLCWKLLNSWMIPSNLENEKDIFFAKLVMLLKRLGALMTTTVLRKRQKLVIHFGSYYPKCQVRILH